MYSICSPWWSPWSCGLNKTKHMQNTNNTGLPSVSSSHLSRFCDLQQNGLVQAMYTFDMNLLSISIKKCHLPTVLISFCFFLFSFVFKPLKAWFCCQNFEANNCIMRLNAQSQTKIVFNNWNHCLFSWTSSTSVLIPWSFSSAAVPELLKTISLTSHSSKVMLKIMLNRLKPQTEKIIAEEQVGFRAGRSTTKQIFKLWILCEKYLQHQQDFHHVFIDFKKAFDRIWQAALSSSSSSIP